MRDNLILEFSKILDNVYGDFDKKQKEPYYGIEIWKEAIYVGSFDTYKIRNGLNVEIKENGGTLAKYNHGAIIYPYVYVNKDRLISIFISNDGNTVTKLDLLTDEASFRYYKETIDGKRIGNAVFYDGLVSKFSFVKYENDKETDKRLVDKSFMLENPIVVNNDFNFPYDFNEEKLNYNKTLDRSFVDYLNDEAGGYAIITYDNDNSLDYEICSKRKYKNFGWKIKENEEGIEIFYADGKEYSGLRIKIEKNHKIIIQNLETAFDEEEFSAVIEIENNELLLIDASEARPQFGDNVARIRNLSEVSFAKFANEMVFKDYYSIDSKEQPSEKAPNKNDPEYKMMSLIGQENAKKEFAKIRAYIQKNEMGGLYKNIIFAGENGTGKSTVGKLISKVLYKYNAVRYDKYIEANGKELYNNFTGETTNNLEELVKQGEDGVILIDDVHYLEALNNSNINEGLYALSKVMERNPNTVFILCDNKYNINNLMENNRNLFQDKIRFKINFKDFTKDELKQIINLKLTSKGYEITEKAMDNLLEVIYLSKAYGNNINATAALSIVEEVIVIQNVRTEMSTDMTITSEDIEAYIKENDISFIDQKTGGQSDARKKLDELVGLKNIKEMVDDLIAYFAVNRGKRVDFHMAFTGKPGTGKTEVARIIGKLLRQEGILGSNKFIEVTRRDLVGQYIGQSAIITKEIIDKAMGGVLYIDEAYTLAYGGEKDFGREVIAELLKAMEDRRGEFCVILAGYTKEMNDLFDLNPGFRSRVKFEMEFPDYSDEELEKITRLFLKREDKIMDEEDLKFFVKIVASQRYDKNFANVRSLREALSKVQIKQARRLRFETEASDVRKLSHEDIVAYMKENNISFIDEKTAGLSDARKELDELIGLDSIKEIVDDLIAYFTLNKDKKVDFHMAFTGNPGTGKTEVARIIGKILLQEGILNTNKFVEVTRRDLVGEYIGHSAVKTQKVIEKAMGGVLYIDEAYTLAYGDERDFGHEVIAELLKEMEDKRGEFCVILAGYTKEMNQLFDLNPGFRSRVKFEMEFPDYSDEELEKIARLFLKKEDKMMDEEDLKFLIKVVASQRYDKNFANVRTLREALSKIQIKQARRLRLDASGDARILSHEDVVSAFTKEDIERSLNYGVEKKVIKVNPQILRDLGNNYEPMPFDEFKDVASEAILALKMTSGEGTGFIVTPDGYFLTCAHCVHNQDVITARRRIIHHHRKIDINYDVEVISINTIFDVALCKLKAEEGEEFDYLAMATDISDLKPLDDVYILGYPFGVSRFDEMSINEGRIASIQKERYSQLGQINLDIQAKGGNSGSPLLDRKTSKVIGVFCGSALSYGARITEEINYARPIDYVWDLLENDYKKEN